MYLLLFGKPCIRPGKEAGKPKGQAAAAASLNRSDSATSSLSSQSSLDTAANEQALRRPNTIEKLLEAAEPASKRVKIGSGKGRGKEFCTRAGELRMPATPQQAAVAQQDAQEQPPQEKPALEAQQQQQQQPQPGPPVAGNTQNDTQLTDTLAVLEGLAGPVVCWQEMYDDYMQTAKRVFVSESFSDEYLKFIVKGLADQAYGFMSNLDVNDLSATESEGDCEPDAAQQPHQQTSSPAATAAPKVANACPATAAPSLPPAVQMQTNDAPKVSSVPPTKPAPVDTGSQASTTGKQDTVRQATAAQEHASPAIAAHAQQHASLPAAVPVQIPPTNDAVHVSVPSTKPSLPDTGIQTGTTTNHDTARQATSAQVPHAGPANSQQQASLPAAVQVPVQTNDAPHVSVPPTKPTTGEDTQATPGQVPNASPAIAPQQHASLPAEAVPVQILQASDAPQATVPPMKPALPDTGSQASISNQSTVMQAPAAAQVPNASTAIAPPQQDASLPPAVQQTHDATQVTEPPTKPAPPDTGSQASGKGKHATATQVPIAPPQQEASLPPAVQPTHAPTKPTPDTGSQGSSNQNTVTQATAVAQVPNAVAPQPHASSQAAVQQTHDAAQVTEPPTKPTPDTGMSKQDTVVTQATTLAQVPNASPAIAPQQQASLPAEAVPVQIVQTHDATQATVPPTTLTPHATGSQASTTGNQDTDRQAQAAAQVPANASAAIAPQQPASLPTQSPVQAPGHANGTEQAEATAPVSEPTSGADPAEEAAQAMKIAIEKAVTPEERIRRQQAHAAYMRFWRSVAQSA